MNNLVAFHDDILTGVKIVMSLNDSHLKPIFIRDNDDLGEGELTVAELAELFIDGRGRLKQIRGIVYPTTTGLAKTPGRPLIKNLDALPFISEKCFLEPLNFYRGLNVMTGRGSVRSIALFATKESGTAFVSVPSKMF